MGAGSGSVSGSHLLITVFPPAAKGPGAPGMHTTDTVDYDIIVSRDLHLELDDGAEVQLKPGDIVVQNGTRHAWHNYSSKPCVMYSVLVGAPRR